MTEVANRAREGVETEFVPELIEALQRIEPALAPCTLAELDAARQHECVAGAAQQHAGLVTQAQPGIIEFENAKCHSSASFSGTCR